MIYMSIQEYQDLGLERQKQFLREAAEARAARNLSQPRANRLSTTVGQMLVQMGERLQAQNAPVRLPGQA